MKVQIPEEVSCLQLCFSLLKLQIKRVLSCLLPQKNVHMRAPLHYLMCCFSTSLPLLRNFLLQHFCRFIAHCMQHNWSVTTAWCGSISASHFHPRGVSQQPKFWIVLIVSGAANQAGVWKYCCVSSLKWFWCADRLSTIWSQNRAPRLSFWMNVLPLWSFLCVSILSRLSSSPSICVFIRVSSFLITCNSSMPTEREEGEWQRKLQNLKCLSGEL